MMKDEQLAMIKSGLKFKNLIAFIAMFYLMMGIASYTQILYFQANNHLLNYSVSYATMAVAGSLTFLITNQFANKSLTWFIRIFIPIYGLGILLRVVYSNPFVAGISGALCGIGASAILLIIRNWIFAVRKDDKSNFIQSSRYTIVQVMGLLSVVIAGTYLALVDKGNSAYLTLIIFSAVALFGGYFINPPKINLVKKSVDDKNIFKILPTNKKFGILLYICSVLLGCSCSIVSSILPALLKATGWSIAATSIITTLATIMTLVFSFFARIPILSKHVEKSFLTIEIIVALLSIGLGWGNLINKWVMVLLALVVEASFAGFFIFKEIMEYNLIPEEEATVYLGLIQSSFLIGDSLGSLMGSYVFKAYGINPLFLIFGIVLAISTSGFYKLYQVKMTGVKHD